MQKAKWFAIAAFLVVSACSDDDNTPPVNLLHDYIPGNVGHEIIYDVSLITKDEFTMQHDTFYYQIKEVVESIFIDNQGRPTQRLERYKRDSLTGPWVIYDVWTSNLTMTTYEKKEENITYLKLTSPVSVGALWNGNALNTLDPQDYEYTEIHTPDIIGGQPFDSTLRVRQDSLSSFIDTVLNVEQFATGVGMVYKEQKFIKVDYSNPSNIGIKAQRLYKETVSSWNN